MVVPVEPISLSLGAVALASLFKTCLECFEYFKAAKSLSSDREVLLNKLDCQRERLLTWGDLVGIFKTVEEGRNEELDTTTKGELVKRCFNSITSLCSDAERLRKEYGAHQITEEPTDTGKDDRLSSSRMDLLRKTFQRLLRSPDAPHHLGILRSTRWAIHDMGKFEKLISNIRELVDDIHNVIPVSARSQEVMIHTDISILGISKLQLLRSACDGIYQTWSDVASAIIMASEAGTVDHRSVGEWIEDVHASDEEAEAVEHSSAAAHSQENANNTSISKFNIQFKPNLNEVFFVFTPQCLFARSENKCDHLTIGHACFGFSTSISFLPETYDTRMIHWNIGGHITKTMDVSFSLEDTQILQSSNYEISELQNKALEAKLPLGRVFIFAAPCSCSIRTALETCLKENSVILKYEVRIDDRLTASCCPSKMKLARLSSIIETMKMMEVSHIEALHANWACLVDRVWVEQRIYQLEEDILDQKKPKSAQEGMMELLEELDGDYERNVGYVFLGEVDSLAWVMQTEPFPWKARMPKESEIYHIHKTYQSPWTRKYLGTFTPRNFKPLLPFKRPGSDLSNPSPKLSRMTSSEHPKDNKVAQTSASATSPVDNNVKSYPNIADSDTEDDSPDLINKAVPRSNDDIMDGVEG